MIELLIVTTVSAIVQPAQAEDPPPPFPGYALAWRDEFEGDTLDSTKWTPWALGKRRNAINTPDAASLDGNGHLLITTTRVEPPQEADTNGDDSPKLPLNRSGGVWSRGLFEPTFGYIEARIQVQTQIGHWGALWLNCDKMGQPAGDPNASGAEIDIFEFHHRMRGGRAIQHNLHWDGYAEDHKSRGRELDVQSLTEGFHTYGLLWTPEEYVFFVDGVETWRVRGKSLPVISHRPEYIILSLEVGQWAGNVDEATLPDSMVVDWVRVWQLPDEPVAAADEGAQADAPDGDG